MWDAGGVTRMRRGLLNFLTLASLVLCVGLLLWWARAQFGEVLWVRCVGHSLLLFGADGPQVARAEGFFFKPARDPTYAGPRGLLDYLRRGSLYGNPVRSVRFAGVAVCWEPATPSGFRAVIVPVAYPVVLTAVLPCLWAASRWRAGRRVARGHCPSCGYDLRASPGRCPECGEVRDGERRSPGLA